MRDGPTLDPPRKMRWLLPLLGQTLGTPEPHEPSEPVTELVATILSQNTSDTNSHRAFDSLRDRFPTWRAVRDAERAELIDAIAVGGLAETKARSIQEALAALPEVEGEPSLSFIDTLSNDEAIARMAAFRGVGVKTAACVLLFAFNRNVCPVDTHVHRVANRLGLVATKDRDRTHADVSHLIPRGEAYNVHVLLVRFGRRVCKARRPLCHTCPLFDHCAWPDRHDAAETHLDRERQSPARRTART